MHTLIFFFLEKEQTMFSCAQTVLEKMYLYGGRIYFTFSPFTLEVNALFE
jgi:hypothetical protein